MLVSVYKKIILVALMFAFISAVFPSRAHAADYTITYINNGSTTTKTYTGGSITLDPLPSGAIAWTDDNDPGVDNGKMAYVVYDRNITIDRNMTLKADYGSYSTGPGPRLIQFHLELKYYEDDINAFLEFGQQYNSTNAPAGYYIHLPNENYFDPITFNTTPPQNFEGIDLHIYKWVYDASYTGTTMVDSSLLHDPSSLIFVDPNNYNQIYNVMVDPNFTIDPPVGGVYPVVLPPIYLPRHTVQFTISQKDLPVGGGFTADGVDYIYDPLVDTSTDAYIKRPVHTSVWPIIFSDNGEYPYDFALWPVPKNIDGYSWEWLYDDGTPSYAEIVADSDTLSLHINTSYYYILQYTPDEPLTPLIPVVVTADRKEFTWDGQEHTASGYTVDGLEDGDQMVFQPRSLLHTDSVSGTNVGTYPLIISFRDFHAEDIEGNVVSGKYTISVIGGGLTILPAPLIPSPPGPSGPTQCTDTSPTGTPNLFQIDGTSTSATLYFTPVAGADTYYISYGYTPGDERFGTELNSNSGGVISYTINALAPNTTYYFRVKAANGCASGSWGNEMSTKTGGYTGGLPLPPRTGFGQ